MPWRDKDHPVWSVVRVSVELVVAPVVLLVALHIFMKYNANNYDATEQNTERGMVPVVLATAGIQFLLSRLNKLGQ